LDESRSRSFAAGERAPRKRIVAIGVIRSESTQIVKALAREASRRYRIRLETSFLRRAGS